MKNNIKNIVLLFVMLSCIYSCTKKNTITVNIEGLQPNKTSKLVFYDYKMHLLDSIEIKENGTHKFTPQWEMPQIISVYERSQDNSKDFLYEGKEISLNLTVRSGNVVSKDMKVVYSSESNDLKDFLNYRQKVTELKNSRSSLDKQWAKLLKKYPQRIPDEERKPFDDAFNNYYKEKKEYFKNYVASHHNLVSMFLCLTDLRFAIKLKTLKNILDETPKDIQQYPYYKALKKRYTILQNVEIGAIAPEIIHPDTLGNNIALSSLRGKYVLLDFWASWCAPCRKENPWVKKAYERFHKKGFDVYAVSLDNSGQKDKWIAAIRKDKLPWHHVSGLKGWKDPAVVTYNISGIPSPFLLDPEGRIIAKGNDLREEKLIETLEQYLK